MTLPKRRARLLLLAWILPLAAYTAMILQEVGPEAIGVLHFIGLGVGTLIVVRRSGHRIGWLLVVIMAAWPIFWSAEVTARTLEAAGKVEAAGWVALTASVLTIPALWAYFVVLWLVFPDGRPSTPTARRLLHLSGVFAILGAIANVFVTPQVLGPGTPTHPHPFLGGGTPEAIDSFGSLTIILMISLGLVAAGRLIFRARHADSTERRQVGWVAVAMVISLALTMYNALLNQDASHAWRLLVDQVATLIYIAGFGVAIMRYRLFEIDRIVSRSVVFGGLAVFIAGLYTVVVVGAGQLLGDNLSFASSVAATVVVAFAFQPVRRWLEKLANRLVYGQRATPYEVLVQFSRRSSEDSDEDLIQRIPQLIVEGTGASEAAVWTRTTDGFVMTSSWPADRTRLTLDGADQFTDPNSDVSLPVFDQGDLLGGLSFTKEEGELVKPADEALVADLASGLGLAMRNTRLTGRLRDQVAELEASRERLQGAADAARRELELTLKAGAEGQLVAAQQRLRLMRNQATDLGADKTSMLLDQLETDFSITIDAVQTFASGVYPPLLESDGIVAALTDQTRRAPLPIEILDGVTGRYSADVESAVYFTALEAIQNTMKYAEASQVRITLGESNGRLEFEVSDNGNGFDTAEAKGSGLVGMADRIDTVGGDVVVESTPGGGTTVRGSIPVTESSGVRPFESQGQLADHAG